MYNEAQKIKFINDYTTKDSTRRVVSTLFEVTQRYEEQWNADLCTRSAEELQPMIDEIAGLKSQSKIMKLTVLKEYVRWCKEMNVQGVCDGMLGVHEVGLKKVRDQMIASPLHLQKCLDIVFPPESENTIDNTYRCFFWLAYAGMEEDDIFEITNSHVDFYDGVVRYQNNEYPLYREALPAFNKAINSTEFLYIQGDRRFNRNRVSGDQILRGIKAMPDAKRMRTIVSKKSLAAERRGQMVEMLTYTRVRTSGVFYRMYEIERAGGTIDFNKLAVGLIEPTARSAVGSGAFQTRVNAKRRGIEADYARWKLSFQR